MESNYPVEEQQTQFTPLRPQTRLPSHLNDYEVEWTGRRRTSEPPKISLAAQYAGRHEEEHHRTAEPEDGRTMDRASPSQQTWDTTLDEWNGLCEELHAIQNQHGPDPQLIRDLRSQLRRRLGSTDHGTDMSPNFRQGMMDLNSHQRSSMQRRTDQRGAPRDNTHANLVAPIPKPRSIYRQTGISTSTPAPRGSSTSSTPPVSQYDEEE